MLNFKLTFLTIALFGYTIPAVSMFRSNPDYSPTSSPQESPAPSRSTTPEPLPKSQPVANIQESINRPAAQQALNAAGNTAQRILVSPEVPNHPRQGWFESLFPRTFKNVDKAADALEKIGKDGATINHELIMNVNTESMEKLNKTGVNLMKTVITAGIGGAIAITGVILLFKTIMKEKSDKPDLRPLYKRIFTNRYLISALLMATGTGIILKSDKIVAFAS